MNRLLSVAAIAVVCLIPGRLPAQPAPQLASDVFLNVPDMGDVPVDEFMETMGMFASALGLNCADCHTFESSSSWEAYADETPIKRTSRRMIQMVDNINQTFFGGQPFVSCWTCHRGDLRPKVVPNLTVQYTAPSEDPNEVLFIPDPSLPPASEIFEEYYEALGGREALGNLTSWVGTGTYNGFETGFEDVEVEVYSNGPDQRTTFVHARAGDSIRVYDGENGWISSTDRPLPLLPLTGGTLDGARIEAVSGFPLGLQGERNTWQMTYAYNGDEEWRVLRGISAGKPPLNLYFDANGLLVRVVKFVDTHVGRVLTQVDYADYREVAGVLLPFSWEATWTNGQASAQLEEITPNVEIDSARFDTPPPAPPARANAN